MIRKRPKDTELIHRLIEYQKPYYTVADLEHILGLTRSSMYVTLNRLVKAGFLTRVRKNAYIPFMGSMDVPKIAMQAYFPSYLSFEAALAQYGILSQVPYTQTFATTRPSKEMDIGFVAVEFHHLKPELFFGYRLENGLYVATREKALLDQLYLVSRGKSAVNIEELDLREIHKATFEEYATKFPPSMKPLIDTVTQYIGTTPITNKEKERISW